MPSADVFALIVSITMHKFALPPVIENSSKILILGSMPGDQSIAKQQYYGNKGNHFWKIMFIIFGESYTISYEERMALLKSNQIALWNVLASCTREGSSDAKIKNEAVNDFAHFHILYPNIKHIFFESKTAALLYRKHVIQHPDIIYHTLPSTSGLNAGISFAQKIEMWKALAIESQCFKQQI